MAALLVGGLVPGRAWGQGISVPLGTAAHFGLLSGNSITVDSSSPIRVAGRVGAAGTISGPIQTDSGFYRPTGPTATAALSDLAAARAYCAGLPAQPLAGALGGATLTPGVYAITGDAGVASNSHVTLTGDSTATYVFNISGRLLANGQTTVYLAGSVRPENVYWNVTGVVSLTGMVEWQGVVLAADSIGFAGYQFGGLTLLTSGAAVRLRGLDARIGNNVLASRQHMAALSLAPTVMCYVLPPANNAVPNGDFSARQSFPHAYLGQMLEYNSIVCNWYGVSTDYFHDDSVGPDVDVPQNACGNQEALNEPTPPDPLLGSYVGLIPYVASPLNNGNYREYAQTKLDTRLTPGRLYYGELFTSLADKAKYASLPPAILLSNQSWISTNPVYWGTYQVNGANVQPQIAANTFYPNSTGWERVAGFVPVPATGLPWNMITIGNFNDDSNTPTNLINPTGLHDFAYYYISNVTLWEMPEAPAGFTGCTATATLGGTVTPALPASLLGRVSYSWSGPNGFSSNQYPITVNQSGTYTLTVHVADLQGALMSYSYPGVQVSVQPVTTVSISPSNTTVFSTSAPFNLTATVTPGSATGTWASFTGTQFQPVGTGATHRVDPAALGAGTYWYTYTVSSPCGPQTANAYVTVLANECALKVASTQWRVIELDTVYDASSAGQINLFNEPGAVYHVSRNVRLLNGSFYLQSGCKIYFDPGTKLTIGPGAGVYGWFESTFTAACDGMWDGILIADNSGGLELTGGIISQSERGIVLQYPDLNLQLKNCQFENNLQTVSIVPGAEHDPRVADPSVANAVVECTFTVSQFYLPWAGQTTRARAHLNFGNWDASAWTVQGNTFDRALVGIFAGERTGEKLASNRKVGAPIQDNDFTRCDVAGILVPYHTWSGNVTENTFTFAGASAPTTAFARAAAADYGFPTQLNGRTVGVYTIGAAIEFVDNTFAYVNAPASYVGFGSLNAPAFTAPLGIYSRQRYQTIQHNIFRNLEAGISLEARLETKIVDNYFENCRIGIRLLNNTGGVPASWAPQHVWLSCNTFSRTVDFGQSIGVRIDQYARVELAHRDVNGALVNGVATPPTPGDAVKNAFTSTASGGTGNEFWHVHNFVHPTTPAQSNPVVQYKTFAPNASGQPANNTSNIITFGSVNVTAGQNMPTFRDDLHFCSLEEGMENGIRLRPAQPVLVTPYISPAPNPADASVTFTYALPAGMAGGELLLRESMSGRIVLRYPLPGGATSVTLSVAALPPGLYLGVLTMNGRALSSVRLQIAH